jgi:hypothetical protein
MNAIFYVYEWLDDSSMPYYIGKGNGKRAWQKTKGHMPPSDRSKIRIVAHNLFENEALTLERKLIAFYGRQDLGTGHLVNKTSGGQGPCGRKTSDQAIEKLKALWTPEKKAQRSLDAMRWAKERAEREGRIYQPKPRNKNLGIGRGKWKRIYSPEECAKRSLIAKTRSEALKTLKTMHNSGLPDK